MFDLRNALLHCADIGNPMKSADQVMHSKNSCGQKLRSGGGGGQQKQVKTKKGPQKIQEIQEHVPSRSIISQVFFLENLDMIDISCSPVM